MNDKEKIMNGCLVVLCFGLLYGIVLAILMIVQVLCGTLKG